MNVVHLLRTRVVTRVLGTLLALFGLPAAANPVPIEFSPASGYRPLMERLLQLQVGEKFEGFRWPNNYVFMRDWKLVRLVQAETGQHILIFFNGHAEKAVVWLEPGSLPVPVPPLPSDVDPSLDRAIDLLGEEYKPSEVVPDGKIYMFRFRPANW